VPTGHAALRVLMHEVAGDAGVQLFTTFEGVLPSSVTAFPGPAGPIGPVAPV
jgi:hypothetical protein